MECPNPKCRKTYSIVLDSRKEGRYNIRTRQCIGPGGPQERGCGEIYTTYEIAIRLGSLVTIKPSDDQPITLPL